MKSVLLLLLGLLTLSALAQRQTFDITSFTPPSGWKNETTDYATSFVKTNNVSRGWCRLSLYKSIKSSGDPLTDFNSEWKSLVAKDFPESPVPTPRASTENGWTIEAGASNFTFNNEEAVALLSTISGYGLEVSIVVLYNNNEFLNDVESFLGTLDLQQPAAANEPVKEVKEEKTQAVTNTASSTGPLTISSAPGKNGISLSTTNFDDGWVAQPFADYVKVTKGNMVVLLHYAIEITDAMRDTNDVNGTLWNMVMASRYQLSNVRKYDNGGPCYFCIDFFEANAVDKASGKSVYVALRIVKNNGIARCIEIIAPSEQAMKEALPTQEKIEALLNYNKFAVTEADVVGTWEESSGSYVNMYNSYTGAYAGMNASSSANKFIFKPGGLYESTHKGAFGMVGSMTTYDQKYNGNSKVTNWEITLTKQFEGKTKIYWAQFEAVRGGRVLHITNKEYKGESYHLVKTK